MDDAWSAFASGVHGAPERAGADRLGDDGWTRKQMLAHIATWHDLTIERLAGFAETGEPAELPERRRTRSTPAPPAPSEGRTTGEIVLAMTTPTAGSVARSPPHRRRPGRPRRLGRGGHRRQHLRPLPRPPRRPGPARRPSAPAAAVPTSHEPGRAGPQLRGCRSPCRGRGYSVRPFDGSAFAPAGPPRPYEARCRVATRHVRCRPFERAPPSLAPGVALRGRTRAVCRARRPRRRRSPLDPAPSVPRRCPAGDPVRTDVRPSAA